MPIVRPTRIGPGQGVPPAPVPPVPDDGIFDTENYYPALPWTYDDCTNAVFHWSVRPETEAPCAAPWPCDAHGTGYMWRPGTVETVTYYVQRAVDLLHETGYENREVCTRMAGSGCTVRPDGMVQPVFCNQPEGLVGSQGGMAGERYALGYGIRSDQKHGTVFSQHKHCVMGIFAYQTPPWVEARLYSWYPFCGEAAD